MYYIRFFNYRKSTVDIEKLYNNGDIQYGDIVCQLYNDNFSHIFINGTWVKTLYTSKLKDGNEIEDDMEILSTSINNNTSNIDNISTRLSDNYIDKNLYVKIENTVEELNNKINKIDTIDISKQLEPILSDISNLNSSVQEISNTLYTLTGSENINDTINTFKELEKFLNDISDSSTLTELLIKTKEDIIGDISKGYYDTVEIDGKLDDINTYINDSSIRLNDVSTRLFNDYIDKVLYVKDEELIASAVAGLNNKINTNINTVNASLIQLNDNILNVNFDSLKTEISDTYASKTLVNTIANNIWNKTGETYVSNETYNIHINDTSVILDSVSTNLNDISTRLFNNYIDKTLYVKDESLIASTFAELNNKINSLYTEIEKLKELLKNNTTE